MSAPTGVLSLAPHRCGRSCGMLGSSYYSKTKKAPRKTDGALRDCLCEVNYVDECASPVRWFVIAAMACWLLPEFDLS